MRGVYTAQITITGAQAAKTLVYIQSPSTCVVEILSASLGNANLGTAEQWNIGLFRVTTIGSPTGTTITPEKHEVGDAVSAAGAATGVLGNLTAEPTTYSSVAIDRQGASDLAGYRYDPIPEERPIVPPGGAIGLRLLTATNGQFTANAQIIFREIG